MHQFGLVHLDLSLENVMVMNRPDEEDDGRPPHGKVIDFGTTVAVPLPSGGPLGPYFVGKKQYAAPEVRAMPTLPQTLQGGMGV